MSRGERFCPVLKNSQAKRQVGTVSVISECLRSTLSEYTLNRCFTRQVSVRMTQCRVRITIVAVATQQCILCLVELPVIANRIKILSVAQQCVYGKCVSPVTINVLSSACKVSDGALKQKNVLLLMASFRRTVLSKQLIVTDKSLCILSVFKQQTPAVDTAVL